jgi:hypothetical protein
MQKNANRWLITCGIGLVLSLSLLVQPSMALCGNCSTGWHDVLACYASSSSNNNCITIRCHADGDRLGGTQPAYCCFDEDPCAF